MRQGVVSRPACRLAAPGVVASSSRPHLFPKPTRFGPQPQHDTASLAGQGMPARFRGPAAPLAYSRGASAIETAIRQDLGMQSTKLPDGVRQRVESAIHRNRYRVTVGEVAALAGITLAEAESALKALAYDAQAVLQVSNQGDVVYVFSPSFQSTLRNKSVSLRVKPVLQKAQSFALLAVRYAFGTALFASIIATFIAITIVLSGGRDDDNGRNGGGGGSGGRSGFSMGGLNTWWYFSPDYGSSRQTGFNQPRMSLPEAIFSFVFGDGNPNADYEERRWRALGRYIQSRRGVVTAEEMAPYLDPSLAASGSALPGPDESFVLPALLKFGGEAFVDDNGQLLYKFPSLQKAVVQREVVGTRPQPQYENRWQMTSADPEQVAASIGLGLLNFVGVATLSYLVSDPATRMALVREGYAWIPGLLPALSVYAAAFFGLPLVRYVRNTIMNTGVDRRNDAREDAAQRISDPGAALQHKLASARAQGESMLITSRDIVFTTEQDVGQQANARELQDWDAKLGAGSSGGGGGSSGKARGRQAGARKAAVDNDGW